MTQPNKGKADPARQQVVDFAWLITDFVRRVHGVTHAIVVSADGLPAATSAGLPPDRADQLAAVASGLSSLTRGAAKVLDGGDVSLTVIEMSGGFLFLMSVSAGACLTVLGSPTSDLGLVAHEMTLLVGRVGHERLTPGDRPGPG